MADGARTGTTLGRYHLGRLLGRGGMGEVYEAHDTGKDRVVALKLLNPEFAQDAGFRERFARESQTAARLAEPHVIPIHDFGEIDGLLFIDMRLVGGRNLADILKGGPLTPTRAVGIVAQVASALDAAHAQHLVHRDVKPANVQVTDGDFAYLLDFGVAMADTETRMTSAGMFVGSQAYAPPERFTGETPGPASDVYSLAAMLYETLTGHLPFAAKTMPAMMHAHQTVPPPAPSVNPAVPASFDAVIARGMAKRPQDRFASCGDLAGAAEAALADGGTVDVGEASGGAVSLAKGRGDETEIVGRPSAWPGAPQTSPTPLSRPTREYDESAHYGEPAAYGGSAEWGETAIASSSPGLAQGSAGGVPYGAYGPQGAWQGSQPGVAASYPGVPAGSYPGVPAGSYPGVPMVPATGVVVQRERNPWIVPLIVIVVALVIALVALGTYMLTKGQGSGRAGPGTVTSTTVVGPSGATDGAQPNFTKPATPGNADVCEAGSPTTPYTTAARDLTKTSDSFCRAVAAAYRAAVGSAAGQAAVLPAVFSPVTGAAYRMDCSSGQIVTCRGGDNAIVYIY